MTSTHLRNLKNIFAAAVLLACLLPAGMAQVKAVTLTDAQLENIVKRSYQYVAMYNVINKFALIKGGWNTVVADTQLKDHTLRELVK